MMKKLKQLHVHYLELMEEGNQCNLNIQQKTQAINSLKLEATEIKLKISEIEHFFDNARKGRNADMKPDDMISLKKELTDNKKRLLDLNDVLPPQDSLLIGLRNQHFHYITSMQLVKRELSSLLANQAAVDLVIANKDKLTNLTHAALSQYGGSFTGKEHEYDDLYYQIGEKICNQLFLQKNGSLVLPTTEEAAVTRDLLLENLA